MAHIQTTGILEDLNNVSGTKTFTNAFPSVLTAGNSAVVSFVGIGGVANANVTAVSLGGTAAVSVKAFQNLNNGGYWTNVWFVQTVGGSPTRDIIVNYGGTAGAYFTGSAEEWAAFAASAADATGSNEQDDTTGSPNLTVTSSAKAQSSEVVYAVGMSTRQFATGNAVTGPSAMSATVTQTALQNTASHVGIAAGYCEVNAGGAESATWTITTNGVGLDISAIVATFKKAAGGGGGTSTGRKRISLNIGPSFGVN